MKVEIGKLIYKDGEVWEVIEILSPEHCIIRELWTLNDDYYFNGETV